MSIGPVVQSEIVNDLDKVDVTTLYDLPPSSPALAQHSPKCGTVMRYCVETSNRLMVHLAELINSYVEVEKASGDVKEVVSPSPRPRITLEA